MIIAIIQLTSIERLTGASYSRTQPLRALPSIKKDYPLGVSLKAYSFHCYPISLKNTLFKTNDLAVETAAVDKGKVLF